MTITRGSFILRMTVTTSCSTTLTVMRTTTTAVKAMGKLDTTTITVPTMVVSMHVIYYHCVRGNKNSCYRVWSCCRIVCKDHMGLCFMRLDCTWPSSDVILSVGTHCWCMPLPHFLNNLCSRLLLPLVLLLQGKATP